MQIVLATRNQHKAVELERILLELDLQFELLTIDKFPNAPEVEETENTFEGNALLKARALCDFTGLPAIADDSGICIDALDGNPGVLSARWSGATENIDQANVDLVLVQTAEVSDGKRGAQFQCAAVAVFPDGTEFVSVGSMPGSLIRAPRGSNGFGYDPIFVANGYEITNAELTAGQKDSISHRGQALRRLAIQMKEHLASS